MEKTPETFGGRPSGEDVRVGTTAEVSRANASASGPVPGSPPALPAPDWGLWIWVGITLTLAVWVFYPILVFHPDPEFFALAEYWDEDENYSYGFLIPPLALYFVWERWQSLRGIAVRGSAWGLPVLALALVTFFVGLLGGVYVLPRVSGILALIGGVLWLGGWPLTRALLFPLLFLFLMIPIPRMLLVQIALPLQMFAAQMAEVALHAVDIPIYRTGNVIQLAHTQLEVAEACSGLRSLLALITTGVVFAYFFGTHWLQRVLIVAMSLPIAILVNAARVAGTGWLAHHYGMETATGYYHLLEGFGMFGLAFVLLASVGFAVVALLPGGRAAEPEEAA